MNKRLFEFFSFLVLPLCLAGCATATRGSSTMFIVETTPIGAKATTTVPAKPFNPLTKHLLNEIKKGAKPVPEVTYRFCEPTPCGIEVPRKTNFHVLVTKDGFTPQVHEIGYMHRKKIKKETTRNTAIAATAGGAATAAVVASTTTSSIFMSSGAAATGAGIVVATPIVLVGAIALGVDASTGANYDPWPNPLPLELQSLEQSPERSSEIDTLLNDFEQKQYDKKLEVPLSGMEERKLRKAEKKRIRAQERAEKREMKKTDDNS